MERKSIFVFVFVLMICGVLAQSNPSFMEISGFGNDEDVVAGEYVPLVNVSEKEQTENVSENIQNKEIIKVESSGDGKFYTFNFYLFLLVCLVVLIILGFFIWLWIRGPINKWEN